VRRAGWVFLGILGGFLVKRKSNRILLLHVLTPNNDEMVFLMFSELGLFSLMNMLFEMVNMCFSLCFVCLCLPIPNTLCGLMFNRRSIGKKRIITYGLDENRSAIFKA